MSLKSKLLGLSGKRSYETVTLPDSLGVVTLRTLTVAESIELSNYRFDDKGNQVPGRERYFAAKQLASTIVDAESKNPLFGEEDLEAMAEWPECVTNALLEKYYQMKNANYVGAYAKNVEPAA